MINTNLTVSKSITELSLSEISRYTGMRQCEMDSELLQRVNSLKPKFIDSLRCKACYAVVPIFISDCNIDLELFSVHSEDLAKCLRGCSHAIVFAATIGVEVERLRRIAAVASPLNHLIYDSMGTTAIECFCDELCRDWDKEFSTYKLRPRFSPGYGDLALETQIELLRSLDAQRKIGLTLSDSLLMIPQKSVTAIVGLKPCNE